MMRASQKECVFTLRESTSVFRIGILFWQRVYTV
jgi:hypothetical protein